MEFRQLEHFMTVARELNFTKAAQKTFISQQALSKSVRILEKELGVPLFERLPRGLNLTEYGQILLKYSHEIFSCMEKAAAEIQQRKDSNNQNVLIALTAGVEDTFPMRLLFEYQEIHPELIVSTMIKTDHAIEQMLEDETIDFAILGAKGNANNIDYYPLIKSNTLVLVNEKNPLSKKSSIKFEELYKEKFLICSTEYNVNKLFMQTCRQKGFLPNIRHTSAGIGFMMTLAVENQGIVFAADTLDRNSIPASLKILSLENDPHFFYIHIAVKHGKTLSENTLGLIRYIYKQLK